jgi:hypothetical protein
MISAKRPEILNIGGILAVRITKITPRIGLFSRIDVGLFIWLTRAV